MNNLRALPLLALLAACGAPGPADDAKLDGVADPSRETTSAARVVVTPAPTVTLLFSAAGAGDSGYPETSSVTFAPTASHVFLWAYVDNEAKGIHIAWFRVTEPSGRIVSEFPVAFSKPASQVSSEILAGGWSEPITVGRAVSTPDGFALKTELPLSSLKVAKALPLGTYTVSVTMDDAAMPGSGSPTSGSASFSIGIPQAPSL